MERIHKVVGSMLNTNDLSNPTFDTVEPWRRLLHLSHMQCDADTMARYKLNLEISIWPQYAPRHQFPTTLQGDVSKEEKNHQI